MRALLLVSTLAILLSSCSRSIIGRHPDKILLPVETTLTYPCILGKKAKTVTCDEVVLTRIDDLEETARNPMEVFEQQFKGVFYHDFFGQLLVEQDLRKMFRKEVSITNVQLKEDVTAPLLKECSTCNAVATIKWRDQVHNYPYTADQDIVKTLEDHYKLLGKTPDFDFALYQNKRGENIKVLFVSSKNITRSYKLTTGTKDQLMDVMRALKFPEKDRVKQL